MGNALKVLVGPQAEGLSASTVSRLKQVWAKEYDAFCAQTYPKTVEYMCGRCQLQFKKSLFRQFEMSGFQQ